MEENLEKLAQEYVREYGGGMFVTHVGSKGNVEMHSENLNNAHAEFIIGRLALAAGLSIQKLKQIHRTHTALATQTHKNVGSRTNLKPKKY